MRAKRLDILNEQRNQYNIESGEFSNSEEEDIEPEHS
jgi:hypothetical protein